jgi:hypothetical protein
LNRRNRAGLKRIGLLALALVIALGAMGVGYAAWTDEVYLEGTVYTGTLDIDVSDCSSTFVYKVPPDGIVVNYDSGSEDQHAPPDGELIASAVADFDNGPSDADTATITFNGLFPEIDFRADLQIESLGTIPVKVSIAEIIPDNDPGPDKAEKDAILAELWELGQNGDPTKGYDPHEYGAWIEGELYPFSGGHETIYDPIGLQLHQFDMVHITLHVRLPQEEAYQNLSGLQFTGLITVIQWNMYGVEE